MSFTLTSRDSTGNGNVLTCSVTSVDKDGINFVAAESSATERWSGKVRHQGNPTSGTRRSNVHLERSRYDATTRKWYKQAYDVTLSSEAGYPWSADDCDDIITLAHSYFDSEVTSGNFDAGASKT